MKRLDEILSKSRSSASSADLSDTSSGTAERGPGDDACPRCGGAGFVRIPRPVDHPRFGKAEPCDCVMTERTEPVTGALEAFAAADVHVDSKASDTDTTLTDLVVVDTSVG